MSRKTATQRGAAAAAGDGRPVGQLSRRLQREQRTVLIMIRMYCRRHHLDATHTGGLCTECRALLDYSDSRVAACPFGAQKPACSACTVHCFRPTQREQIRAVMRYAGPRMTLRHPYLAVRHLLDSKHAPS